MRFKIIFTFSPVGADISSQATCFKTTIVSTLHRYLNKDVRHGSETKWKLRRSYSEVAIYIIPRMKAPYVRLIAHGAAIQLDRADRERERDRSARLSRGSLVYERHERRIGAPRHVRKSRNPPEIRSIRVLARKLGEREDDANAIATTEGLGGGARRVIEAAG